MIHSVLTSGAAFAVAVLATTVVAHADANLNCDAYAGAAVAQHQQNVAQGCGLAGGRWSDDFAGHRNWCLQPNVQMENLTAEDNARRAALAECAAKPALDQQACQTYANRAVMAADAAAKRSCGFQGGRWGIDYAGHFEWCLGAPQSAREQEDQARAQQLQGCLNAQAAAAEQVKKDACAQYASTAVNQQKENVGRQCEFAGGRWGGDWFGHFNYCMGVSPQEASNETAIRVAALKDQCMYVVCTTKERPFSTTTSCDEVPKPWQ